MTPLRNRSIKRSGRRPLATKLAAALASAALTAGVLALAPTPAQAGQDVVVSPDARADHPKARNGRIYDIDSYGSLVAVAGSFTIIRDGAEYTDISQQWLFLYNSATGKLVRSFAPQLGGPTPTPDNGVVKPQPGVEQVEFAADGQSLYIGGWFTTVNGQPRPRVAQLNLDGSVRTTFNASASNTVRAMELVGNRLIIGGDFVQVNGQRVDRLTSLDPVTGKVQTDFAMPATQSRDQYAPYVIEMAASPNGRWLAVAGSFERIANQPRNQLALIDLSGPPALANWSTEAYAPDCSSVTNDTYIRGLAFSPDSSFMVVNTTGAYVGLDTMCDTSSRWELPPAAVGPNQKWTWRLKTGGDTLYAAHITKAAIYLGGHQRWLNNPRPSPGGDNDGPGAVVRPGVAAVDPLTGVPLSWNPGRDRGRGAEAIHSTDQFLFVGSDTTQWGTQLPGGPYIRQRLAVLPVTGGTANPQPVDIQVPVNLHYTLGSTLYRVSFDGATLGTPQVVSGPEVDGIDWSGLRDGFVQNDRLHYFGPDQNFWSRPFSNTSSFGPPRNLSETVGYVDTNYDLTPDDQPYGVAETTVATYRRGRIYYVKSGDAKLYWRGYSLESGIVDANEQVASSASFSSATALDFIGDWLYVAWSDGKLYRFYAPGGAINPTSRTLVDAGTTVKWAQVGGMFSTQA